jgi:hypothetical protein
MCPNWCDNDLIITGPAAEIAKFKKKAASLKKTVDGVAVEFCLEPFLPLPKELDCGPVPFHDKLTKEEKARIKATGYKDWYHRNLAVLGTKWDVEGELTGKEKTRLGYTFSSAWSPPEEGVRRISELYPKLHFTLVYDESSMDFAGTDEIENGEFVSRTQTKSPQNQEDHGGN